MDSPYKYSQEAVMADYRQSKAFKKNPLAQSYLHKFFSPSSVPIGLTDNQISICIRLYPFRERYLRELERLLSKNLPAGEPTPLPTLNDALELFETGDYCDVSEAEDHLDRMWEMSEILRLNPYIKRPQTTLPKELIQSRVIEPKSFRNGIRAFIVLYRTIFG